MRFAEPALPISVSALPFLFVRQKGDDEWRVRTALAAAAAAERADETRRTVRGRLCYLLSELGYQLARRGGSRDDALPLPRGELAAALGVGLWKVKRTLALLALSRVIEAEDGRVRIRDWPRLAAIAQFDRRRLDLRDEPDAAPFPLELDDEEAPDRTVAGDPACFV